MESYENIQAVAGRSGRPAYRSAGEAQLAGLFEHYGIAYRYEQPVAVFDKGKVRIWYPDFQLPDYGVIVEYCGMPDVPEYAAGMIKKARVYRENGLAAVLVTPQDMSGDWPTRLLNQIEGVLQHRWADLQGRRMQAEALQVARRPANGRWAR